MFKLNYVKPEEAEDSIKDAYSVFPQEMGVPAPIQMFSVSPNLLESQINGIKYFMRHQSIPFPLLVAIRLISANELCYDSCIAINSGMLKKVGMSETEISSLLGDMTDIPFEENEITLLKLVSKIVKDPKSTNEDDIHDCRDAGWSDTDIFDAAYHASAMATHSRLFSAFQK